MYIIRTDYLVKKIEFLKNVKNRRINLNKKIFKYNKINNYSYSKILKNNPYRL